MGRRLGAIGLLAIGTDARAHAFSPDAGHFYNGLLHAFVDPGQILLLLALALLAAQRDLTVARAVAVGVPLLALAASLLPARPEWLAFGEVWVLVAAAAVAALVAWGRVLPTALLQVPVYLAALGPGLVNGAELARESWLIPRLYLSGAALGIFFLLMGLFVLAASLKRYFEGVAAIGMRVLASWVVAGSAMLLALRWA
ncbi:MAG: HupE/UreJ family protein [Gammaproteobacteria bacterium]|nr:HupE/UreJ family protein [Gammaproteobacteria bacterium]